MKSWLDLQKLAFFSFQGLNHQSLIGDLNPSEPIEIDCNAALCGWPHIPLHREKFQGAAQRTFKSQALR